MKMRSGFVLCAAMVLLMQVARAGDSDVTITTEKKRFENKAGPGSQPGSEETTKTEQWGYSVTVENQTFKALTNLQVKYIIFYKHEQLGIKAPPRKETKSGASTIAQLDSLGKTSFDTDSVTLSKTSLNGPAGGYTYFANGAKSTAADTLSGVWVRIYQDGSLFAVYSYPAGLTTTEKWK